MWDYDFCLSYVLFDMELKVFEFKCVEYDVKVLVEKIFVLGLEFNFGYCLFIGV